MAAPVAWTQERIEAEDLAVTRITQGDHGVQEMEPYAALGTFGQDKVVHWFGQAAPGDVIEFTVPVAKPGKYRVTLGIVKSWDYGIYQPMVDGKDMGRPLDLFSNGPEEKCFAGKVEIGTVDVKREHILLGMRFTGTNPKSKADPNPGSMGLDWVMLTPVTQTITTGGGSTDTTVPTGAAIRIEAEDLDVARATQGDHATYEMTDFRPAGVFGGDKAVHWFGQDKPGDLIEFRVAVGKPGRYSVTLGLVKSWDYGIFQPMVDGKPVGKPIDLYSNAPEGKCFPLRAVIGTIEVKREHILLGMRYAGVNPRSKPDPNPRSMALDWVQLTPITALPASPRRPKP
jgi:hypothetical protein